MSRRVRKKLEITCTSSNCESGLHCFRATRKMKEMNQRGRCRSCGVALIDWERLHRRDLRDTQHTFSALRREFFRHHYWHLDIDRRARNHARRKGWNGLSKATRRRLETAIGAAQPFRDGTQTPRHGNSIYYAQHAVACCCRKCLEYWHGIPRGRTLSAEELSYLSDLCMLYLRERMPYLTDHGEKVPPIRTKNATGSSGGENGPDRH